MRGAGSGFGGAVWFGGFRFDSDSGRLWRDADGVEVTVRPKTASVLSLLVARPGEVVSKRELLATVWPDGFVGDAVLTTCVNELRQVLGDDRRDPRFIATAHRRGYRFVAPLSLTPDIGEGGSSGRALPFVGRDSELATLDQWWQQAREGVRQLVFVAAEAGVGKTMLVDASVDALRQRDGVLVGRGQCVEQFGGGEAYLPLLDALSGLCRGPAGHRVVEALRAAAPTWLLQLPGVVDTAEAEGLRVRTVGMSEERMLRELGVAMEVLTVERPLLLVCEDLHLSDRATTEALAYLARRREPARLMLVGTYRPAEAAAREHRLGQVVGELRAHDQCRMLLLEPLARTAVAAYLADRLSPGWPSAPLVDEMHERTDGNALFVTTAVDHLIDRDLLVEVAGELRPRERLDRLGIPDSVGQFIEHQLDELVAEDRQLLEVAAAVGVGFTAAAVHAGASADQPALQTNEVEDRLSTLARDDGMVTELDVGEWPDGTLTACYRFRHALYQEVLYGHLSPRRRVTIHHRVGERLAAGYGPRAREIAAELAMHFERGRDYGKAIPFFADAAEAAQRRVADRETLDYASRGVELLERTEATPGRAAVELRLRMLQVVAMVRLRSPRGEGVEAAYRRARAVCHEVEDPTLLGPILYGLWKVARTSGDVSTAAELAEEFHQLSRRHPDPVFQLQAHHIIASEDLAAGRDAAALEHFERAIELYDLDAHRGLALVYGQDPAVECHKLSAYTCWLLGYPDQAARHAAEACRLSHELGYPNDIFDARSAAAFIHILCGDPDRAREDVDAVLHVYHAHGLTRPIYHAKIVDGWAVAQVGDPPSPTALLPDGPAERGAAARSDPFVLSLLAETLAARGDTAAGLDVATEALDIARREGDNYEAEVLRLRSELMLRTKPRGSTGEATAAEAEQAFLDALDIARRQQAKSLELRAATSVARLWRSRGQRNEARDLLADTYNWFTEGHDTGDLKQAAALLAELD